MRLTAAFWRLLPAISIGVFALTLGAVLASAGSTLGFDFLAYHSAASRVLEGKAAYDTSFQGAGGFGLFYYPPTFIPLVLPFGLLGAGTATWIWVGLLVASFAIGTVLMPVSSRTQWLIVLLAGISWPFLYAVKLGQVGPLLYLLFAAGWRGIPEPMVVGVSGALGAAIKMQPGLILLWALLTGRTRAVVYGLVVLGILAVMATILAGSQAWNDFFALIGRVSDPITTPHNFTPGAIAYQNGVSRDTAALFQYACMGLALVAFVTAALWLPAVPSYLVAVVASQLLSPILWDHYALLLLLPVAWLMDRGWTWTVLIPLATSVVLVVFGFVPAFVYPAAFGVTLFALLAAGFQDRGRARPAF